MARAAAAPRGGRRRAIGGGGLVAASIFSGRTKFSGIRWLVDCALAPQGCANDEDVDEPARSTNTAPAIADLDGDGDLDIVVSLKDAVDRVRSVLVFEVPGSSDNCLAWPTGRGSLRRDGWVPPPAVSSSAAPGRSR